jgi:hypothetical protein
VFSDKGLFRETPAKFPDCSQIVARVLPHGPDLPIEQQLQSLQDEAGENPNRHRQLAAVRYYLHTMIAACQRRWLEKANGITNHVALLDELHREERDGICLVTFNYDTLIEHALESVDVSIRELPSYVANNSYKLIKLHRSVDWAHPIFSGVDFPPNTHSPDAMRRWIIENIASLKVESDQFQTVHDSPVSFAEEAYVRHLPHGVTEKTKGNGPRVLLAECGLG